MITEPVTVEDVGFGRGRTVTAGSCIIGRSGTGTPQPVGALIRGIRPADGVSPDPRVRVIGVFNRRTGVGGFGGGLEDGLGLGRGRERTRQPTGPLFSGLDGLGLRGWASH